MIRKGESECRHENKLCELKDKSAKCDYFNTENNQRFDNRS